MSNEEKYYTRSNGEKVKISEMETTHLNNSYAKKLEELFNSTNKTDFSKRLEEVNNLKNEYHKRLNKFYEGLGE